MLQYIGLAILVALIVAFTWMLLKDRSEAMCGPKLPPSVSGQQGSPRIIDHYLAGIGYTEYERPMYDFNKYTATIY